MMQELIRQLHETGCSCVVANGTIRMFSRRGVLDLYSLLGSEPEFLRGALVADKVVGKAAAALLLLADVKELYADLISTPALRLLQQAGARFAYGTEVPSILNREGTQSCPLETICMEFDSPQRLLPLITKFIDSRRAS